MEGGKARAGWGPGEREGAPANSGRKELETGPDATAGVSMDLSTPAWVPSPIPYGSRDSSRVFWAWTAGFLSNPAPLTPLYSMAGGLEGRLLCRYFLPPSVLE